MSTFNEAPFKRPGVGRKARVGVLGAPYDFGSTTRSTGQAMAPRGIRMSYVGPSVKGLVDLGDVEVEDRSVDGVFDVVADEVKQALANDVERLIVLGGDDSISYGVLSGMNMPTLIHFDAHDDMSPDEEGDGPEQIDHSNWVRMAVQNDAVREVIQFGLRAPGSDYQYNREWILGGTFLNELPTSEQMHGVMVVDMDVFSPGDAPGVAVPEPAGWPSGTQLSIIMEVIKRFEPRVLVITECVPALDVNEITQRLAFSVAYRFATTNLA